MDGKMKLNKNNTAWFHVLAIVVILAWGVSFPFTKILLNAGIKNGVGNRITYFVRMSFRHGFRGK